MPETPRDEFLSRDLDRPVVMWSSAVRTPGHAAVHVAGQLDLATAPIVRSAFHVLTSRKLQHLDLHLEHVTFCDCAGLDALLGSRRVVARHGGTVRLHDPCPSLQILLDVLDLTLGLEPVSPSPPERPRASSLSLVRPRDGSLEKG